MARKEEFKYKGYYVVHIEIADKHNPNLVISKWSVWGLGIYNSWEDAENAILDNEHTKLMAITKSDGHIPDIDEEKEYEKMRDNQAFHSSMHEPPEPPF